MEDGSKIKRGISRYIPVYIALLALSGLQVFLAYAGLDRHRLLASMLAVAIFSAALAIMYFMHMAQERRSFFWSLIPATIFVLLMMNMIWSDSFRLLRMRPF
jgi:cytochrome c oxidase subunit IV